MVWLAASYCDMFITVYQHEPTVQGTYQGQLRSAPGPSAVRERSQDGHGVHPGDDGGLLEDCEQSVSARVSCSCELRLQLQCQQLWYFLFNRRLRERDTNVYNMVVSPTREGGHIHLNPAALINANTPLQSAK